MTRVRRSCSLRSRQVGISSKSKQSVTRSRKRLMLLLLLRCRRKRMLLTKRLRRKLSWKNSRLNKSNWLRSNPKLLPLLRKKLVRKLLRSKLKRMRKL